MGAVRRPAAFQAARWRGAEREKGEGACGRGRVEKGEEGRGGQWRGGRQHGAAGIAARTGKGAGTGDAVQVADARARARQGTWCQQRCAGERGRATTGCRHMGPGGTALGGAVQTRFKPKPKFKRDQIDFKILQTLTASNMSFQSSKNLKIMVLNISER
jgi:hypothetical protein